MGLGKPQLPGQPRAEDGGAGGRAGAAVIARDQDDLRARLGHAGRHGSHAGLRHQLYGNAGRPVGVLQIIDQLSQILDGIDIVMRRGRDQGHAGGGMPGFCHPGVNLVAGQMSALAGLGTLGHFNLNVLRAHQVFAGDAEPAGGHLLDGRAAVEAVGAHAQALLGFSALAAVGLATQKVHGDG
ncbi:hypothetical protein SDC9_175915 [bioreactor metagenome]|uniref:Uncharacterized protein n=1 Tax=bioreactor metagenome TaxID=1076179 RepID=A0A645GXW0_9ZZZZ